MLKRMVKVRTTLTVEDDVLRAVKVKAARTGRPHLTHAAVRPPGLERGIGTAGQRGTDSGRENQSMYSR